MESDFRDIGNLQPAIGTVWNILGACVYRPRGEGYWSPSFLLRRPRQATLRYASGTYVELDPFTKGLSCIKVHDLPVTYD